MKKKTVAVIFGGCSTEYDVSRDSACSVIGGLDPGKYDVVTLGITRRGEWLRYGGGLERIKNDTWESDPSCAPAVISPDRMAHGILTLKDGRASLSPLDVAFPVLHGRNGEDGTLQGLLEMAGIPFVGCGTLSCAVCMDKDVAHRLVRAAGIKTPRSFVLNPAMEDKELHELAAKLKYPLFVKPANSGSSVGISKAANPDELSVAVAAALLHDAKVIIEEAVEGFEVGCAVLGNDRLTIGEVDEIELSSGFFDYTEKYTLKTSRIFMPARISARTAERIKRTAASIYRILGCRGLARVDMFLTPGNGIVFNEVNTIPGFTSHSRYPSMLGGIGLSFAQILDELIMLAEEP